MKMVPRYSCTLHTQEQDSKVHPLPKDSVVDFVLEMLKCLHTKGEKTTITIERMEDVPVLWDTRGNN